MVTLVNPRDRVIMGSKFDPGDNLDLIKFGLGVHSNVRNVINDDYILAHLTEKQREYIQETFVSGNMAYRYIAVLLLGDERSKNWQWNKERKSWILTPLSENVERYFETLGTTTSSQFMGRSDVMVGVHRNDKDNFALQGIFGINKQEEEPEVEEVKGLAKLKEQLKMSFKQGKEGEQQ